MKSDYNLWQKFHERLEIHVSMNEQRQKTCHFYHRNLQKSRSVKFFKSPISVGIEEILFSPVEEDNNVSTSSAFECIDILLQLLLTLTLTQFQLFQACQLSDLCWKERNMIPCYTIHLKIK